MCLSNAVIVFILTMLNQIPQVTRFHMHQQTDLLDINSNLSFSHFCPHHIHHCLLNFAIQHPAILGFLLSLFSLHGFLLYLIVIGQLQLDIFDHLIAQLSVKTYFLCCASSIALHRLFLLT